VYRNHEASSDVVEVTGCKMCPFYMGVGAICGTTDEKRLHCELAQEEDEYIQVAPAGVESVPTNCPLHYGFHVKVVRLADSVPKS
jgi:hypothetical protein